MSSDLTSPLKSLQWMVDNSLSGEEGTWCYRDEVYRWMLRIFLTKDMDNDMALKNKQKNYSFFIRIKKKHFSFWDMYTGYDG